MSTAVDSSLSAALQQMEVNQLDEVTRKTKSRNRAKMRRRLLVLFLTCVLVPFVLTMTFVLPDVAWDELPMTEYGNGAVAADNGVCSSAGVDILRKGGNAVDAAVSTALCQGVLNPFASGIGGGAYMTIALANGTTQFIDMRDAAPAAATVDMYYTNYDASVTGGLSVAVPGELAGLYKAWELYGTNNDKVNWTMLFDTPIQLALGAPVGDLMAVRLQENQKAIEDNQGLHDAFVNPLTHSLYKKGEFLRRDRYAATLKRIAKEGPGVLYGGSVGADLVQTIQENEGIVTLDDLKNYEPVLTTPTKIYYDGFEVISAPLSSSGGSCVSMILNILELYDLRNLVPRGLAYQYMIEAMKWAFSFRGLLGDPAFVPSAQAASTEMQRKEVAGLIRRKIVNDQTFPVSYYNASEFVVDDHGTSHLSVMDVYGNAVSMTTTVNMGFGSKILCSRTGIVLNDQMNDFSVSANRTNNFGLLASKANDVEPGKRPLSSMSPTIVLRNGIPYIAIGASGGPKIITSVVQTLVNVLDWDMSLQDAITSPRFHAQLDSKVIAEPSFSIDVMDFLRHRGHNVTSMSTTGPDPYMGNVQAVQRHMKGTNYVYTAFSDFRKMGKADGY